MKNTISSSKGTVAWLVEIMKLLLSPNGCPWDRKQTLETLKPFLIEEAYEVLDAIDSQDRTHHCEELGDLLLQIVFQSELAQLSLDEIASSIGEKLIRRHPHVFGDLVVADADQVVANWEEIKRSEKHSLNTTAPRSAENVLCGVPKSMPALLRANRLSHKAAKVGFDWATIEEVRHKVEEELGELDEAIGEGQERDRIRHELGDLLFAIVNLARKLSIDAEDALRLANQRFESRFGYIADRLSDQGQSWKTTSAERLDALWEEAKRCLSDVNKDSIQTG